MAEQRKTSLWPLLVASFMSLGLLAVFWWLQSVKASLMDLKAQWLALAFLPLLVALIAGKYLDEINVFGIGLKRLKPRPETRSLRYTPQPSPSPSRSEHTVSEEASASAVGVIPPTEAWTAEREREYARTNGLFLVHAYEPSTRQGQKYDVTIYLMRHVAGEAPNQRSGFSEVESLEFFLGPSWNNKIIVEPNAGGLIGMRTSAWGSFLATARVVFRNGRDPLILQRYVDFEMAPDKN